MAGVYRAALVYSTQPARKIQRKPCLLHSKENATGANVMNPPYITQPVVLLLLQLQPAASRTIPLCLPRLLMLGNRLHRSDVFSR